MLEKRYTVYKRCKRLTQKREVNFYTVEGYLSFSLSLPDLQFVVGYLWKKEKNFFFSFIVFKSKLYRRHFCQTKNQFPVKFLRRKIILID